MNKVIYAGSYALLSTDWLVGTTIDVAYPIGITPLNTKFDKGGHKFATETGALFTVDAGQIGVVFEQNKITLTNLARTIPKETHIFIELKIASSTSNDIEAATDSTGKVIGLENPRTGGTVFFNALTNLKVDTTLNDVPVDKSNILSVVASPTTGAANTATEYATMIGQFTKVYSFNQAANSNVNANKYLYVAGGFPDNRFSQGVFAQQKAWPQIGSYYSNGMFETLIDAKDFVIVGFTNSGNFQSAILIDGKSPTDEMLSFVATTGNQERWITVTLRNRRPCLVSFTGLGNVIKEIRVRPTDTINKPDPQRRMAIYGDSFAGRIFNNGFPDLVTAGQFIIGEKYTILTTGTTDFTLVGAANSNVDTVFVATGVGAGTGTATSVQFRLLEQFVSVGARVSRMLGFGNPILSTQGGTGFGTAVTDDTYLLRMNLERGDPSVAICWIFGTGNDNENSPLLRGLMHRTFDKAKQLYPNAQIILTSCYDQFPSSAASQALNAIYTEVVNSRNDVILIPVSTWHTGDDGMLSGNSNGSVQSPNGSGNADLYLGFTGGGADRHWNARGIRYGAEYIARKIATILSKQFN